jgi:hypothetical protein
MGLRLSNWPPGNAKPRILPGKIFSAPSPRAKAQALLLRARMVTAMNFLEALVLDFQV